ncbi:MAG TPA: hypothetical protein PLM08_09540, partial [Polyangiaceae bacterium]|nr:hypothetical protein [Polyangiaceae bacterium]
MLSEYRIHVQERARLGIPPLPLRADQARVVCDLLLNPPVEDKETLLALLRNRIPPGVDPAAEVKAAFLTEIAHGRKVSPLIDPQQAVFLLGTMLGGYNVRPLVELLAHETLGSKAAEALSRTLLVFDAFDEVAALAHQGNENAKNVLQAWADATWFTERSPLPERIDVVAFKVAGEINTDDFSP